MFLALHLPGISSILFTTYPIHLFQELEACINRALTAECIWGKIYLRMLVEWGNLVWGKWVAMEHIINSLLGKLSQHRETGSLCLRVTWVGSTACLCSALKNDVCVPFQMASWGRLQHGISGARSKNLEILVSMNNYITYQPKKLLLQAEDRMNPERLGQLQHYIGSAREKQERWKSRVQGGNLFKKNQVVRNARWPGS